MIKLTVDKKYTLLNPNCVHVDYTITNAGIGDICAHGADLTLDGKTIEEAADEYETIAKTEMLKVIELHFPNMFEI